MDFFIGDQFERVFYVEEDGLIVDISEVSGLVYETKFASRKVHEFIDGTITEPNQLDAQHVQFLFTPEITSKFRPDQELTLDVYVGSLKKTFTGIIGTPAQSELTKILNQNG